MIAKERIRPIVVCLFRRDGRILVEIQPDAVKGDWFCRPLGGAIEFGEDSQTALAREIQEELGAEIENVRLLGVLENLFVHEGQPGHEIVFVYDAAFVDKSLYQQETLQAYEHGNHSHFTAQWQSLAQMKEKNIRLVPEGLLALLTG